MLAAKRVGPGEGRRAEVCAGRLIISPLWLSIALRSPVRSFSARGACWDRPSSCLARTLWVGLVCRRELFFETAAIGRAVKRVEFSVKRSEKAKPPTKCASRARLDDQLARQFRIVEIDPDGDIAVRSRRGPAPSAAVVDHDPDRNGSDARSRRGNPWFTGSGTQKRGPGSRSHRLAATLTTIYDRRRARGALGRDWVVAETRHGCASWSRQRDDAHWRAGRR